MENKLYKKLFSGELKEVLLGESGIANTLKKVKKIYSGEKLYEKVTKIVTSCDTCQRFGTRLPTNNFAVPIIATRPFEIMSLDAVRPIQPVS
ncbi:hypothetical protein AYI69_g4822 [Smittium culicis]|uniref:Integrase zinc-binding domain-containing protein n=1 Tax=Smittium culicis TaxID=133412 RepID=A0A1R1YAK3_9FUNG|nr:hypothetical protein AYI69_g4822 [Smittium culicis]